METALHERRPELDGLRALAVLAVVFCHATEFGPAALSHAGRSGARGVDLFFVISGFCLAYPALGNARAAMNPAATLLPFLRRRFARIAPPFYAAIALFGALAFTRFGLPTWPLATPSAAAQFHAMGEDALFFTGIHPIHNCDFWSLGVEMRWYVLFPLFLALFVRSRIAFAAAMLAMYVWYASPWAVPDVGMYPCFMFGIAAAGIVRDGHAWAKYAAPLALVLMGFGVWRDSFHDIADHGDPVWHAAAFFLVVAVAANARLRQLFAHPAFAAIGIASYSIYLIHHPVLAELAIRKVPVPVAVAASLVAGGLFWYGLERPLAAKAARERIEAALMLRRRPAVPRYAVAIARTSAANCSSKIS